VWRVPIFADRPATWADATRVISEHAYIEFFDLSPDGKQLAVSSDRHGNQDLYILPAGGGELTPLTTDPTADWSPRWSPDGSEIAFYSYRSGNRDIWVMPARGGPARQITSDPGQDWFPSWSPDGREIAFHSTTATGSLSMVGAKGGEPRQVATGIATGAEWSPDGQSLLVMKQGKFFRVGRDGGDLVPIAPTVQQATEGRFSRDGQSIYYTLIPTEHIWKLSLRDGKISQLTNLQGQRGRLGHILASDDRYIYFGWRDDDGDIWVMDVASDRQ
jgi:TolB protein